MTTGRRAARSELSTIDSAILFAGVLVSVAYFQRNTEEEREIRRLGDALYRRADWEWARNGGDAVSMGWSPERGFLRYRWKRLYDTEYLFGGPLFMHQLSHVYIDFRGIRDAYMRVKGIDYFENSRRATYIHREYAIRNPRGFAGYGANAWGITASDGPGPALRTVNHVPRRFWAYRARGVPYGPDDGTLSPRAVVASLPFAPDIVIPPLIALERTHPEVTGELAYKCSYNETFGDGEGAPGWMSQGYYAIDQGPVVLMIENYRSEFVWNLMRSCPYIVDGLRAAGFEGGWLADSLTPLQDTPPRTVTGRPSSA